MNTADVLCRHRRLFSVYALVAQRNVERMCILIDRLHPRKVVMTDEVAARMLAERRPGIQVESGMEAAIQAASDAEVDVVVAAIVGAVGIAPTLAAVEAGKRVALANKECLVSAGRVFKKAAEASGATILPVDSEHAAIHQCLLGHEKRSLVKVVLTASGGPFLHRDPRTLKDVTPREACAHPNWEMGAKISVDSATMMNKALELIEARWLFDLKSEEMDVIVHPQSVVHGLVYFRDGSILAQMAEPDMRGPIAYALQAEPRLESGIGLLELAKLKRLEFLPVDEERFPAMRLVRRVLSGSDSWAIAFNAANEVANASFRQGRLAFDRIVPVVESVVERTQLQRAETLEQVLRIDAEARAAAEEVIREIGAGT